MNDLDKTVETKQGETTHNGEKGGKELKLGNKYSLNVCHFGQ